MAVGGGVKADEEDVDQEATTTAEAKVSTERETCGKKKDEKRRGKMHLGFVNQEISTRPA